jgi:hypothetical protein
VAAIIARPKRAALIAVGILVAAGAVGAFLLWFNGSQQDAIAKQGRELATALERGDPSLAPAGGEDYVAGVESYFRGVSDARFLDARPFTTTHGVNENSTVGLADIVLETRRGPALIEATFDGGADPSDVTLELVYELRPERIPAGLVDATTRERVVSAYSERGGKPADLRFDQTAPDGPDGVKPEPPSVPGSSPELERARRLTHCVADAHGDVEKLQRCTAP